MSGEAAITLSTFLACPRALKFVCHLQVLTRAKLVRGIDAKWTQHSWPVHMCFGCHHSRHPCRCFLGAVTSGIYLNKPLNAFVRWAHISLPAPPRLRGYPSQDAWCWVWLVLGGVCGRVVCLGYMCLAVCFITCIFSGADVFFFIFSVLWTCVGTYLVFWCGTLLFHTLVVCTHQFDRLCIGLDFRLVSFHLYLAGVYLSWHYLTIGLGRRT